MLFNDSSDHLLYVLCIIAEQINTNLNSPVFAFASLTTNTSYMYSYIKILNSECSVCMLTWPLIYCFTDDLGFFFYNFLTLVLNFIFPLALNVNKKKNPLDCLSFTDPNHLLQHPSCYDVI